MQHTKQPETSSWGLSLKHLKQKWSGSNKHKCKTQDTQDDTKKYSKESLSNSVSDCSDKENRDPDQPEYDDTRRLKDKKSFFSLRSATNKTKSNIRIGENTFQKPEESQQKESQAGFPINDTIRDSNKNDGDEEVDTTDVETQDSTSDIIESSTISQMYTWFVGDLDKSVTETMLFKVFSEYPGLMSLKIPKDVVSGDSLCYAYVNYDSIEHADAARDGLNYTTVCNSEIRIMPSIQDKSKRESMGGNVFLSHLPENLTTRYLYEEFKKYGFIMSCKYISQKGQCFILYKDKIDAIKMIKQVNNTEIKGHTIYAGLHINKKERNKIKSEAPLLLSRPHTGKTVFNAAVNTEIKPNQAPIEPKFTKVDNSPPPSTEFSIFIKNLPLNIEDHVITGLVEQYGKVQSVLSRKVPMRNGTWALVTLTNQESVNKSIAGLNAFDIEGQKIFVTRAIPREQKSYARMQAKYPQKRFKILISGFAEPMDKSEFEKVCNQFEGVSSVELYKRNNELRNSPADNMADEKGSGQKLDCRHDTFDYGYVTITREANGDELIARLKKMFKCSCYKVGIEIPNKGCSYETPRFDYSTPSAVSIFTGAPAASTETRNMNSNSPQMALSYLNPTKMYRLSSFGQMVENDRQTVKRAEEKKAVQEAKKVHFRETERMADAIIWELVVRLFEEELKNRTKEYVAEMVEIMVDYMVQVFWKNRFWNFWNFLEANQMDDNGKVLLKVHPLLKYQLVESGIAFGVIRPEKRYGLMEK